MSFSCQKREFDQFFNRLNRPVEESRPDRQPDRPFDPTGFRPWPTSSGPNPARTRKYKPEPGPNPKTNFKPKSCPRKPKVKLGLKNLAMLPNYFGCIFMHLRQKVRLRPKLSPKFFSTSGLNPVRARTRPEKPGLTYNSATIYEQSNFRLSKWPNKHSTRLRKVPIKSSMEVWKFKWLWHQSYRNCRIKNFDFNPTRD